MTVYMKISKDEYELPEAIADSAAELAKLLGVKEQSIFDSVRHSKSRGHRGQYVKVEIGDE